MLALHKAYIGSFYWPYIVGILCWPYMKLAQKYVIGRTLSSYEDPALAIDKAYIGIRCWPYGKLIREPFSVLYKAYMGILLWPYLRLM